MVRRHLIAVVGMLSDTEKRGNRMKALLSGNEAIARGAYEYGVHVATGYPGTPSTEVVEQVAAYDEIYSEWSANEKVALDTAIGAAYLGRRSMAVMKMAGLNVAADSLFYVPYTGLNGGGLVIVVADDPGQYSSQTEQDSRNYALFAKIPMLEPSDSQEARDFVGVGLDLSIQWNTPVLLRTVMRVSHSASVVELGDRVLENGDHSSSFSPDHERLICTSPRSRKSHPIVQAGLRELSKVANSLPINRIEWADRRLGIVSSGIAYQYAKEVFAEASFLKLGLVYPVPEDLVKQFASGVEELLVIEELDPFLEERIKVMGIHCRGKEIFPAVGEFTPGVVAQSAVQAGLLPPQNPQQGERNGMLQDLPSRSPTFCPGCPHRSTFYALKKMKDLVVAGDIGCYNLASLPPFDVIDTAGSMGASVGVAHGLDVAGIEQTHVAVIGDSTLFHTGLSPLANVVHNGGSTTVIVLDNETTAMTGHQDHPGVAVAVGGRAARKVPVTGAVRGCGIGHVQEVDAFDVKGVETAIGEALAYDGPSAIVVKGACRFVVQRDTQPYTVDPDRCIGCGRCFRLGCPAVIQADELSARTGGHKACIDTLWCVGCDLCRQVCPQQAIHPVERVAGREGNCGVV